MLGSIVRLNGFGDNRTCGITFREILAFCGDGTGHVTTREDGARQN